LEQAASYQAFLVAGIENLAGDYERGRPVSGFPELLRIVLKRRAAGHGHYVVFEVNRVEGAVHILHLWHTRMDLEGRLRESR
jgi:plasmid stabilization system protein ParE